MKKLALGLVCSVVLVAGGFMSLSACKAEKVGGSDTTKVVDTLKKDTAKADTAKKDTVKK